MCMCVCACVCAHVCGCVGACLESFFKLEFSDVIYDVNDTFCTIIPRLM